MGAGSRLARLTADAILPGLGLAIASTALLTGIVFIAPAMIPEAAWRTAPAAALTGFAALALPLIAHGLFVTLLTRRLLREPWRCGWRQLGTAFILAAIMFGGIWLDGLGTNAICTDGKMQVPNSLPQLPWAWIGWGVLVMTALPARLLGYPAARLVHWSDRTILAAPFAVAVLVTGLPFQYAVEDCAIIERWGVLEGGLFLLPLLALFLFTMSFSLAILNAAFVRPDTHGTTA